MNFQGLTIVILYLIISALVIILIFITVDFSYINAAITVTLWAIGSIGAFLIPPFRKKITPLILGLSTEQSVSELSAEQSLYRICVFGRSGIGKTTLIENAFIYDIDSHIKSTDKFDFYTFSVSLQRRKSVDVAIADYKGQNPSQIVLFGPPEFFGHNNNRLLNAVLFMVDLVPKIVDEQEYPISDEALIEWLKKEGALRKIETRIEENYGYINEVSLELFFSRFYSKKNLKSVKLLITKVDLVDKLISDQHITLSDFRDAKEYAQYKFRSMIENIHRFCDGLGINDFSVHIVRANSADDLKPIIAELLKK